jgi:hypothetical protein
MEKAYKNTGYFFLILVVLVAFGFYKPYFALFPDFNRSFNTIVHIHATALLLWVVLLVVQPLLIRNNKFAAHRSLGKFTYFLVPVIIISSVFVIKKQYNEAIELKMTSRESFRTLLIPISEIFFFSFFYLLAIINKRNVALHMRYIICSALVLITPSLARVTGFWFDAEQLYSYILTFLVIDIILIMLIAFDLKKRTNYRPYVIALVFFLIFQIWWYAIGHPF